LPPDQFIPQLMERLGTPYYAGLLSASRYHGAAHQQPQLFQVVVPKNRPPIRHGLVAVEFIARRNAGAIPTIRVNTPRGFVAVSSPEATAFDLVGYSHHCGGLGNVATVLAELVDRLDPQKLRDIAPLSPTPWAQRLGFLLDLVGGGERTKLLADYVAGVVTETVPLSTVHPKDAAPRDARWKLAVNVEPELDS
jgi:predicted transcriptional regulator of viral defense system